MRRAAQGAPRSRAHAALLGRRRGPAPGGDARRRGRHAEGATHAHLFLQACALGQACALELCAVRSKALLA